MLQMFGMRTAAIAASTMLAASLLAGQASAATPSASDRSQIVTLLTAKMTSVTKLVVGKMFQEETYVIARWTTGDGNGGGEALVKNDGTKWVLLKQGGGTMDNVAYLESAGVPPAAAKALAGDLDAAGGH